MEPLKKSVACTGKTIDRFSDLPDELVHHILSFLTVEVLGRLSFASRRCQELCNSSPVLSFSNKSLRYGKLYRFGFKKFLSKLMRHREFCRVKTQSLRICWPFGEEAEDGVQLWLQHAVNSGVEELHLNVIPASGEPFFLPTSVLGCQSLRSLVVSTNNGVLDLPSMSSPCCAPKLRVLVLDSVQLENNRFQQWISSFKSLKMLILSRISGIKCMNISNSSIEQLTIANVYDLCHINIQMVEELRDLAIFWKHKSSEDTSLQISAPNLRRLFWAGQAVDSYSLGSSSHLWHASISLSLPTQWSWKEVSWKAFFDKVLCSIQHIESLMLPIKFVEVLLKYGCLPFLFSNLESLSLSRSNGINGDEIQALSTLLKGTTKLKYLTMSRKHPTEPNQKVVIDDTSPSDSMFPKDLPFKVEYWEAQVLTCTDQVKKVTMEFCNEENELALLQYFLKNAKELEEMIISYLLPLPPSLITKLRKFKQTSSRLRVYPKLLKPSRLLCNI